MHHPELLLRTAKFDVIRQPANPTADGTSMRATIVHPGAVTILPLLPGDRICLIRNHRPAVGATLIELPAGTLEPDEDPATTAARELTEETGYVAGRLEHLIDFWMSPGILRERMHLFLASELTPGPARPEADEQIETMIVERSAALEMVRDGTIQDAKSVAGLLYFEQFVRR